MTDQWHLTRDWHWHDIWLTSFECIIWMHHLNECPIFNKTPTNTTPAQYTKIQPCTITKQLYVHLLTKARSNYSNHDWTNLFSLTWLDQSYINTQETLLTIYIGHITKTLGRDAGQLEFPRNIESDTVGGVAPERCIFRTSSDIAGSGSFTVDLPTCRISAGLHPSRWPSGKTTAAQSVGSKPTQELLTCVYIYIGIGNYRYHIN